MATPYRGDRETENALKTPREGSGGTVAFEARVAAQPSLVRFCTDERGKNSKCDKSQPTVQFEEEIYRRECRKIEEEVNDSAVSRGSNKIVVLKL